MLQISGEDAVPIDRKQISEISLKLNARLMVLSNELPRLPDASGALAGRLVLLRFRQEFWGREDKDLTARLLAERSGILLWAIEGWRPLRERGRFVQPQSGDELLEEFDDISSPVGAFVKERCRVGPEHQVSRDDLYAA